MMQTQQTPEKVTPSASSTGLDRETAPLVVRPLAEVFEDADGITIRADLPGVSKDRLHVQVDGDTLTIAGEMNLDLPEGMRALHTDLRASSYRRAFTLSSELDAERISANLEQGVLTLKLPKREEAKPRRIEVNVA